MMKTFVQKEMIFSLIFCGSVFAINTQNHEDEIFNARIDRVEETLTKVPQDILSEMIMMHEKGHVITGILNMLENDSSSNDASYVKEDKDTNLFRAKEPRALSEEEKKINIYERIAKQHIGELPSQIKDVINYFTHHDEFVKKNWNIYNRLLLHGKPGTGKTTLLKIIAQELQIPHFSFTASIFADKYIGESSRKIRKAFDEAKKLNRPVFIFIDELDALAAKRKDSTHDEHRAALITLLTELQDLQDNPNIFVACTTNLKDALDVAILDRFAGSICEIKDLDKNQKAQLIQKVFSDKKVKADLKFATRLAEVIGDRINNREVEYLVRTSLIRWDVACKSNKNSDECNKQPCPICPHLRKTIEDMGKKASFSPWIFEHYSDGI